MKIVFSLLVTLTLTACTGPFNANWGVLPASSQVCPNGTNSAGQCH
ncbi:hypothetical protein ACVQKW_16110 [Edwardsiella tarda]|uniref:Uncharacterized protein n=1 Tax=Edwardsiella tarda ATCC 15947 = NBRC 105688 TaxID=667121 RepID=A0AC61TLZ9_EDWTA|nr:hypothetical protein [Edwardsiella tarda]UAL55336.1 hypothetical protein K8O98_10860 [Edwardsiella tarda]UBU95281.1 hypothetical protein AAW15_16580 [Edwardsiella tarda]UCQ01617.1 hypothetical protein DCL27_07645 [Edwardsiella tarda ATCC 15947 = NBRC 105688]UCQ12796.1 hypothetical protein DCF76_07800 [Edwardsiella tarda]UCQ19296.1 hypothetical protein DCF79_07745 [Edwardsiella tarda]